MIHNSNEVPARYAITGWESAAGATAPIVVKGSDGNNCNLVFAAGLYVSTTCP